MKAFYLFFFVAALSLIKIYLLLKGARESGNEGLTLKKSLSAFGLSLISFVILPLVLLVHGYITSGVQLAMLGLFVLSVALIIFFSKKAL